MVFPGNGSYWDYLVWRYPKHPLIFKYHAEWVERCQQAVDYMCENRFKERSGLLPIKEAWIGSPQTLKSVTSLHGLFEYTLARCPNARLVIFTENDELAAMHMLAIRTTFEDHEGYIERFGRKRPGGTKEEIKARWNNSQLICGDRTEDSLVEPSISVQGVRGLTASVHYDGGVIDDPHPRTGKTFQDTTWRSINDLRGRMELWSYLMFVANVWGSWDAAARVKKLWVSILTHPLLIQPADEGETYEDGRVKSAMPELIPDAFLNAEKSSMDPYDYSCRYRLDPLPPGSRRFDPAKFQIAGEPSGLKDSLGEPLIVPTFDMKDAEWRGLILDPAGSHKGDGSDHALVSFGWFKGGWLYVNDIWMRRCPLDELLDKTCDWVIRDRPGLFGIEQVMLVTALESNFKLRFQEIAHLVPQLPIMEGLFAGGRAKGSRVLQHLTHYDRRLIVFNPNAEHLETARDQILMVSDNDEDIRDAKLDGADAWGYIHDLSKGRVPDIQRQYEKPKEKTEMQLLVERALAGDEDGSYEGMEDRAWMAP